MTTRNNKVREAILRLAGMREGWTLLADTIPDEFLNQVSIRISELEQQLAQMTAERDSESRRVKQLECRYAVFEEMSPPCIERKKFAEMCFNAWMYRDGGEI